MDRNGYNPSIMQRDLTRCYLCGRSCEKLDRHEIFGGALRAKSKRYGLWVMLCHWSCHLNGAHRDGEISRLLRASGQERAQDAFGWTTDDFIAEFGKNYL